METFIIFSFLFSSFFFIDTLVYKDYKGGYHQNGNATRSSFVHVLIYHHCILGISQDVPIGEDEVATIFLMLPKELLITPGHSFCPIWVAT